MQKHKVAAIVTEYNPFHKGHEWMITQLRNQGFSTIVCVMSGTLVQRAEPAFYPAAVRAKAAVLGGVDLCLRLPAPYSCSSAEVFAKAAVDMITALGCVDSLAFGCETADTRLLWEISGLLEKEEFSRQLKIQLKKGVSFAAARAKAAQTLLPGAGKVLGTPNNILGIEYCKALQQPLFAQQGKAENCLPRPKALALPRLGASHDGLPVSGVASASWLRKQAVQGGVREWEGWVPPACQHVYLEAEKQGKQLNYSAWEFALMARLRGMSAQEYKAFPLAGEGLSARLAKAVQQHTTLEEAFTAAKTKRFAHSRVRRLALWAGLGLPVNLPEIPPFLQVLAASSAGLCLLKTVKEKAVLPVSTSLAKLQKTSIQAAQVIQAEAVAEDFSALCRKIPEAGGDIFTQPVFTLC